MIEMDTYLTQIKCDSTIRCYSIYIITILFLFVVAIANAYDVVLTWDPNVESDLAGYKIYGSEGTPGPPHKIRDRLFILDIENFIVYF